MKGPLPSREREITEGELRDEGVAQRAPLINPELRRPEACRSEPVEGSPLAGAGEKGYGRICRQILVKEKWT
jgi:hypothetical protein